MRNNKLNKKEKLKVYELALKLYIEASSGKNKLMLLGMCYYLQRAVSTLFPITLASDFKTSPYSSEGNWKELHDMMPVDCEGAHWWNINDTQVRIDAFEEIIKKLK